MSFWDLFRKKKPESTELSVPINDELSFIEPEEAEEPTIEYAANPIKHRFASFWGYSSSTYDPHNYYLKWESQYIWNPHLSTPVNTKIDLLMAMMGKYLGFVGDTPADTVKWEKWVEATSFEVTFRRNLRNFMVFGNSYGLIADMPDDLVKVQLFEPNYMYAIPDEYDPAAYWDYREPGNERVIKGDEMKDYFMIFADNQISDNPYGIPNGAQVYNTNEEIKRLEGALFVMAHRSSHGLLDVTVNSDGLNEIKDPNKNRSPMDEYCDAIGTKFSDRIKLTKEAVLTIMNELVHSDRVTVKAVKLENDIPGTTEALKELKETSRASSRVPGILMDKEGNNRAESYTALMGFAAELHGLWLVVMEPYKDKLLPALKINGHFTHDDIMKENVTAWMETADRLANIYLKGGITKAELRVMLSKIFDVELDPDLDFLPPPSAITPGVKEAPVPKGETQGMASSSPIRGHALSFAARDYNEQRWDELEQKYSPKTANIEAKYIAKVDEYLSNLAEKKWNKMKQALEKAGFEMAVESAYAAESITGVEMADEGLAWVLQEGMHEAWLQEGDRLGTSPPYEKEDELVRWLENDTDFEGKRITTEIGESAKRDMIRYLKTAKKPDIDQLNQILSEKYRDYDTTRLVRSELHKATTAVGLKHYALEGVDRVFLLPVGDDRTCFRFCWPAFERYFEGIPLAQAWGILPLHPNERCVWVPLNEREGLI